MIYTIISAKKPTTSISQYLAWAIDGKADRYIGHYAVFHLNDDDRKKHALLKDTQTLWLEFKPPTLGVK